MTIANAANIDAPGVLIATSGLSNLILSEDQSTIEIGAGNTWSDVYRFLEAYKLVVVGGRAGKLIPLTILVRFGVTNVGRLGRCARIPSRGRYLVFQQ